MSFIHLLDKLYALIVQLLLFCLHVRKNVHSCLGIHEFFGIEAILELLDGIVLFQLVELYHSGFPGLIESIEFALLASDSFFVERVKLGVFSFVFRILIGDLLLHKLIHLGLKIKGNINELLSHAS